MAIDEGEATGWQESNSATFVDNGRIYTPDRDTIARTFVDCIPAHRDGAFCGVEIGHGQGWLMDAILGQYPNARCRDRAARIARGAVRPALVPAGG